MLGLGRALGETIAVAIILSPLPDVQPAHPAVGRQHDPGHDRPALQRVRRARPVGADGGRPDAVRADPAGEHRGVDGGCPLAVRPGGGDLSAVSEVVCGAGRRSAAARRGEADPPQRGRGRATCWCWPARPCRRFALVWLLYTQLAPFSGTLGFVLLWFVAFVAIYWICERELEGPLIAADKDDRGADRLGRDRPADPADARSSCSCSPRAAVRCRCTSSRTTWPSDRAARAGIVRRRRLHAIVGTLEQVGLAVLISRAARPRHGGLHERGEAAA